MGNCLSSLKEKKININEPFAPISNKNIDYAEIYKNYDTSTTKYLFDEKFVGICRVIDIYDGDTCKIALKYPNDIFKYDVRLLDLDTPEIRTKSESEKKAAINARDRFFELVTKNRTKNLKHSEIKNILSDNIFLVKIDAHHFDKYGRLLAILYSYDTNNENNTKSFNQILIDENHGYNYFGGKKIIFNSTKLM